ncbi:spectrin repeat-containing domain protein [Ostertagia ostertagi]
MDSASGRRMADALSLNALATRINSLAPGPEANKFLRNAENFANDCGSLNKRINLAIEAAQRKVDLAGKFNRLTEEARQVVDAERQALNSGAAELTSVERVVARLAEINGFWNRSQRELSVCAEELKKTVPPSKAEAIDQTMVQLNEDFASLNAQLQQLESALSAKKEDMEKLSEKSSRVKNEANAIFMELSDLDPVARSIAELNAQQDQVKSIEQQLVASEDKLQSVLAEWNKGVADGVISQPQMENNQALAEDVTKLIEKARKKLAQREKKIEQAIREVEAVHRNAAELVGELNDLRDSEALKAVVTVSDPVTQAEKLKTLKDGLKAIGTRVDDFVSECKLLIRTGGPEADTAELDNTMKEVCDTWSAVSTAVAEKEREADSAVQQLGRYEDAYKSLLNWIEETEELMENQRPPAADARVAKAQLHAYDVLMKHIDDKDFKYNALVAAAHDRQRRLIEAVDLAERLSEGVIPVETWLSRAEKRLNALGKIPTNVEKMEEQLREQKDLDDEVDQKAEDVDHALAIIPMLSALVSVEDANSLEAQANQITSRYESIAHRVRITRDLLQEMALTVSDLFADLDSLEIWLGDMEQKMDEISEIAIAPDDLNEQSNIVGDLVTAITERDAQITAVIEVGRQLCRQATGDEALPLQYRMDQLKKRYGDIMLVADEKLQLLAKAIPLSERFHEGFEAVMEWVEAVEEDLIQIDSTDLDTQTQLVFSMEEGVSHWRPEVDDLIAVSSQLQALSSPDQADELFQSTAEMNRRVNQIADKVARRAERLDVADRQSRAVFDELSFLLEWLGDARDRVVAAGPPSIDPDFARTQLRNQLVMNEDARLREMTVEAKKVCRELGGEGGESGTALAEQCDHAKDLVDEVTALCMDRTEILERALALSQHLTIEFDRLANWSFRPQILTYVPIVEQFKSDVKALQEICVPEDGVKLGELADEIVAKYDDMRKAVEARGQALDSIVDATSGLEYVGFFGSNTAKDPDRGKSGAKEGLRSKQAAYAALKESAAELLSSLPSDDSARNEVSEKLRRLAGLWKSIEQEADDRGGFLESTLAKAERFWHELDECQRAVRSLRCRDLVVAMEDAMAFHADLSNLLNWLDGAEKRLAMLPAADSVKVNSSTSVVEKFTRLGGGLMGWGTQDCIAAQIRRMPGSSAVLSVSTLNAAAQRLLRDDRNTDVLEKMNEMNKEWRELNEILEALTLQMERAKADAEKVGRETEQWMGWLEDVESQLATTKPTEIISNLSFFMASLQIAQNKPLIENYISETDAALENADTSAQTWMARNHALIKNKWSKVKELCVDREKKLQLALGGGSCLDSSMRDTAEWLAAAEQRLAAAKQLEENEKWVDEVAVRKQLMAEQQAAGTRLQYYCEKKDAIPIKNGLVSLKHRFEKVASRTADRTKQLNAALDESRVWMNGIDNLKLLLEDVEARIPDEQVPTGNANVLKQQHNDIKKIQSELASRQQSFDTTYKRGRALIDHAPRSEAKQINEISAFDDAVLELESWIDAELTKNAATDGRVLGDIDTVKVLAEEHRKREAERLSKQRALDTIITKVPNVDLRQALSKVEDIKVELSNARENRDLCLEAGRALQAKCHPRAEQPLKHWLRVVETDGNLLDQQQQEKEREEALFELLEFVAHKREELNRMLAQALPQDFGIGIEASFFDSMRKAQRTFEEFDFELRERQADIDGAVKLNKKGKRDRSKLLKFILPGDKIISRCARVSDLFRRYDRSHTGNIPRDVFIDAVLASKFPTSRLEMNKVADLFDKGDGLINSKEFIDALRFDRTRELKPLTDHEKVNEEITKQKNACSCCQQFKIEKVADGHYRVTQGPIMKVREKTERSVPMFPHKREQHDNEMESSSRGLLTASRDSLATPTSRSHSRASDSTTDERPTRIPSLRIQKGARNSTPRS